MFWPLEYLAYWCMNCGGGARWPRPELAVIVIITKLSDSIPRQDSLVSWKQQRRRIFLASKMRGTLVAFPREQVSPQSCSVLKCLSLGIVFIFPFVQNKFKMLSELLGCKKGKLLSWKLGNSRLKTYKFVPQTCTPVKLNLNWDGLYNQSETQPPTYPSWTSIFEWLLHNLWS